MIFVQFYQLAVWPIGTDKIIEAVGDRSVIVVDGRWSDGDIYSLATDQCKKRKFIGWRVFKGETFTKSHAIGDFVKI